MPSTFGERTSVALFLFSLAVRPLPDSFDGADFFQLDRAEVGKLATAANVPVGRNTLYKIAVDIAESADALTVDRVIGSNRRFIRLEVPQSDDYSWLNEVFADLDDLSADDLDAAVSAAAEAGFDTSSALPPALVLPYSLGAEEKKQNEADRVRAGLTRAEYYDDDSDDNSDVDDDEEKCCTKCKESKTLDDFPVRTTDKLSSWCRACHRAATADWRSRNPGKGASYSSNSYATRSHEEVRAAQPTQKFCSKCRRTQYANAFTWDKHRRDGLSAHCRVCRRNHRVTHPTQFTLPPIAHR